MKQWGWFIATMVYAILISCMALLLDGSAIYCLTQELWFAMMLFGVIGGVVSFCTYWAWYAVVDMAKHGGELSY